MPNVYRNKEVMKYNDCNGALAILEANGWSAKKPEKKAKKPENKVEEPENKVEEP